MSKYFSLLCFYFILFIYECQSNFQPWSYRCDEHKRCIRTKLSNDIDDGKPLGLSECKLTCDKGALFWPLPREIKGDYKITELHPNNIVFANAHHFRGTQALNYLQDFIDEQIHWLKTKKDVRTDKVEKTSSGSVHIYINLEDKPAKPFINKDVDESYFLDISLEEEDFVLVNVTAKNYFGARHAIETLFQAMEFDDVRNSFVTLSNLQIHDYPEFSHRGISLDSSRNFMTLDVIKRIIDGMAHSKLNVFHWHITDTHSFPVELIGSPINKMTQYGAYDAKSIYTQDKIKDLVDYANRRGVRVIPELDQPAHVGNGWNFPEAENFTVCTNAEPWYKYCVEPPCGQLNPAEPGIYDILEKIYKEFYEMFQFDVFHMGADEVNFNCWNTSSEVINYMESNRLVNDEEGFIELWSEFQKLSSERLKKAVDNKNLKIIVWTSHITQDKYIDNLPNDQYIVQIWTNGTDVKDEQIKTLVDKKYQMIFSNYEALYLDCGYGAWVGEGNNWCSPYKGWQKIYSNDLYKLIEMRGFELTENIKNLVLGSEVAMWSEQVDSETVEGKIFPRAAALAERLWTNPSSGWYEAETRMLHQRERLVQRGVRADRLQPEWCLLNEGQCYSTKDDPNSNEVEK